MVDFDFLFPDEREKGDTLLKQCQIVMLRMLKILDYLCARYQVEYFLIGGSLLGAIRHKGFIPWDDDLDVGMTRNNYEKFMEYVVPELPKDIFFQNEETDKFYPYSEQVEARLRDKYSSYNRSNNKWHEGLQVDIFVYDRAFLPGNFFIILQNILLGLLGNNKRVSILKWLSKTPFSFVYASSYLQNLGMLKFGRNYIKEKECSHFIETKFEDMKVFIPAGWHSCLKRQYGDYMKLPPKKKQKGHHGLISMPDPFTPCFHKEILTWKSRISIEKYHE
jgi:lipopolysaccharide cholinephosphotransferase